MADYASNAFMYNGTRYVLMVNLYTLEDGKKTNSCSLDIMGLDTFEYTNELNDLLLHGRIVYTDKFGIVDQFIDEQFVWCDVMLARSEEEVDGPVVIQKLSDEIRLTHTFLADGIQILSRSKTIINYQIDLVSSNALNCSANIVYSNYDKGPQPVFDILKNCMNIADLQVDTASFDNTRADVDLQYITTGNDSLLTITPYLMRRLYYSEQRDNSLKFLLFNEHTGKYQLFDMKKPSTSTGNYDLVVSFFKSSMEHLVQQEPVNFGVVTKTSKTKMSKTLFTTDVFSFEYDSNRIVHQLFSNEENIAYFSNKFDNPKLRPKVSQMIDVGTCDFRHRGSTWNNDIDFYHDYQHALSESNALVVNSVGELLRKPGSVITLNIDRTPKDLDGEDQDELERLKTRYKTFEGPWIASKVRHIIEPNKGPEGNGSYRQNIVLMRNFLSDQAEDSFEQQKTTSK